MRQNPGSTGKKYIPAAPRDKGNKSALFLTCAGKQIFSSNSHNRMVLIPGKPEIKSKREKEKRKRKEKSHKKKMKNKERERGD